MTHTPGDATDARLPDHEHQVVPSPQAHPEVQSQADLAPSSAGQSITPPVPATPVPDTAPAGFASEIRQIGIGAIQSLTPGMTPESPAEMTARVGTVPAVDRQQRWARTHAFNWRLAMMRIVCAALAVTVTILLVPGLSMTRWYWGSWLVVGVLFGLLNAVVKPVLQFLVLRFIFSTYGMVVVLINSVLLWALDRLTDDLVNIDSVLSALLGGLGVGVLGLMFETVLGANPPILDNSRILEASTK